MTSYIVLREEKAEGGNGYWFVGSVDALNSKSAIQQVLSAAPETGRYVAVPARSFQPVDVKVETKTAVKVGP